MTKTTSPYWGKQTFLELRARPPCGADESGAVRANAAVARASVADVSAALRSRSHIIASACPAWGRSQHVHPGRCRASRCRQAPSSVMSSSAMTCVAATIGHLESWQGAPVGHRREPRAGHKSLRTLSTPVPFGPWSLACGSVLGGEVVRATVVRSHARCLNPPWTVQQC